MNINNLSNILKLEGFINNNKKIIYFVTDNLKISVNKEKNIDFDNYFYKKIKNLKNTSIFTNIDNTYDIATKKNTKSISSEYTYIKKLHLNLFRNKNLKFYLDNYIYTIIDILYGTKNKTKHLDNLLDEHIIKNYSELVDELDLYIKQVKLEWNNDKNLLVKNALINESLHINFNKITSKTGISEYIIPKIMVYYRTLYILKELPNNNNIIIFGNQTKLIEILIKNHNFTVTYNTANVDTELLKKWPNNIYPILLEYNKIFLEINKEFDFVF